MKCAATLVRLQVKSGTAAAASPLKNETIVSAVMAYLENNQASLCEIGQSSTRDGESSLRRVLAEVILFIPSWAKDFSAVKCEALIIAPMWNFSGGYQKEFKEKKGKSPLRSCKNVTSDQKEWDKEKGSLTLFEIPSNFDFLLQVHTLLFKLYVTQAAQMKSHNLDNKSSF